MLVRIAESTLTSAEKMSALFRGWAAVDVETGARLYCSGGRTAADPKWFLILPRDGKLFGGDGSWERSIFRATDLDQALVIAEKKLLKLRAKI